MLLGGDTRLAEAVAAAVRLEDGRFVATSNAEEAWRPVQNHPPEILLLDLKTAEADALTLLRQMKQLPAGRPIFVVALTPGTDANQIFRAFDLGIDDFMLMPFDPGLFRARLRHAVLMQQRMADLWQRQHELTEACRTAEANSLAKSEFLAAMSHEIRTPMNGVIAMTGLMFETPLTPDQRGYLETIHSSSESLLKIINDILDFSKIEAGKMELEKRPFDLRASIEDSVGLLAPRVLEKHLDLGYTAEATLPTLVAGDEQRLRQVLVNLLSNAVKFTEHGDVFVRVEKVPPPLDDHGQSGVVELHFSVRDTGIGIAPDRLSKLFRPFSQADVSTARKYGGTGLGLAISRRLVELMGGKMWAETVPEKGSTFHFTIKTSIVPDSTPPAVSAKQNRLADLKILIVDDSPAMREMLAGECRRWGMAPTPVATPAAALELFRNGNHFDLALIDLVLGDADGVALAAELQTFPAGAMMPVIMLTPLGRKSDPEISHVIFAHSVHKPVKPAQLCAALERALLNPKAQPRATEAPKSDATLATKLPLRILLVDDNAINQKVAMRILQQIGYTPDTANNGREALEALDRKPYDFIFMDVMMPVLDGHEATRLLRKRQMVGGQANYDQRIVVVAMTAHAMAGDREKCLAAGMDDYLSKPVRPKDVRDMVEKWAGTFLSENKNTAAPKPVEILRDEPPVDMDRMNDLTDGNHDSLRELVEMYFKQTNQQMVQMHTAIHTGRADEVRRVAHSCAGASATLGMAPLVPKLRELEKLGASGALPGAADILKKIETEYARIKEFLAANPELAGVMAGLKPA